MHAVQPPSELPSIERVDILEILGVTVSSRMTVAEHIDHTLCSGAQTVYALQTLRAHGMNAECLNKCLHCYHPCKTHGACTWIGFTRASERDRIEAFIRRCKRSGFCSDDTATFAQLCDSYVTRPTQPFILSGSIN